MLGGEEGSSTSSFGNLPVGELPELVEGKSLVFQAKADSGLIMANGQKSR